MRGGPGCALATFPKIWSTACRSISARLSWPLGYIGSRWKCYVPGEWSPDVGGPARRFVLVADDLAGGGEGGPLIFDLIALADDVRTAPRLFVISTAPKAGIYAAAYQSAVQDLKSGHDVALVVETRPAFAESWARTLSAMQNGGVPSFGAPPLRTSGGALGASINGRRMPSA